MSPRLLSRLLLALSALAVSLALAACGGEDGETTTTGASEAPETPPQQVVDAGDPAQGEQVFADNCAACHGPDGGGGSGPALAGQEQSADADAVVTQIRRGGGGMPAFGDRLSEQELADVSAHVVELAGE